MSEGLRRGRPTFGRAGGFETQRLRGRVAQTLFGRPATSRVGRFEIGRLLGRGGMGSVYEAFDTVLQRWVAIKLFRFDVLPTESCARAQDRLLQEARTLALLQHDHVVPIYEAGVDDGLAFIAMEKIVGLDLHRFSRTLVARGRARCATLVGIMQQAAQGMAAIHAAGLVHGDFKPANVLVGDDGRTRVVDLGLARLAGADRSEETTRDDAFSSPGRTDGAQGTPAYMAPEQGPGSAPTPASDCYSFCLSFAELLLDTPVPSDPLQRRRWVRSSNAAAIPLRLRRLLIGGLDENPNRRPRSMVEFSGSLRDALGPDHRLRRGMCLVAMLLLVAAARSFVLAAEHPRATTTQALHVPLFLEESE